MTNGHENQNIGLAVSAITGGVLLASLSDAFIKFVSTDFQLWQLFILRSAVTIPVLWLMVARSKTVAACFPNQFGWTALRSLLLTFMWVSLYAALPWVDLAVAGAAYYTLPLFITIFAAIFIGDRVGIKGWTAVLVGFSGVLLILRPQAEDFNIYTLLPLASAVFYAAAMIITRARLYAEDPLVLSLNLNLAFLVVGALGSLIAWAWTQFGSPSGADDFLLGDWTSMGLKEWVIIAVLATLITGGSQLATIAYQSGPPSVVSSFDFFYLPFVVIWGFLFFDEVPAPITILGIALIAGAGIFILRKPPQTNKPDAKTAYIIFQETIDDLEMFEVYKKLSPASIAKFGGRFIVRGGPVETLEGHLDHERIVVIAFPTREQAKSWYHSSDYTAAKSLRLKISTGDAILVDGHT